MTETTAKHDPDPRTVYADIIDLPHHRSPSHPHMTMSDRAGQFLSYKALSGYEDMIAEEVRETDTMRSPGEEELEKLNRKLERIGEDLRAGRRPVLSVTFFEPDERKAGGRYVTVTAVVRRVDACSGWLELDSGDRKRGRRRIALERILEIRGEAVDAVERLES